MRLLALALALAALPAAAQRRLVPDTYATVQAAIRAAAPGDTVLVRDGRYVETIDFLGKDIVVASHFALDRDPAHIAATILDGSAAANPDSASTVVMRRGETRAAVLEGFTVTGGAGTRWTDEQGEGFYQEGGGILVAVSSPTIRYNRITGNRATRACSGCTSAGGGGLRAGNGAPLVEHNVFDGNEAMYGGGAVFNHTAAVVRNNVVVHNRVVHTAPAPFTFGGGGLWFNGDAEGDGTNVVENNTVAENAVESSVGGTAYSGHGGGVLAALTRTQMRGNVVWGNTATGGTAWRILSPTLYVAEYNDVQDRVLTGTGNVSADPLFIGAGDYRLGAGSPAIDAGDPALLDPEDAAVPGMARPPARGTTRSDVGAYGGPGAAVLLSVPVADEPDPAVAEALGLRLFPNPTAGPATLALDLPEAASVSVRVFDALGRLIWAAPETQAPAGVLQVTWAADVAPGLYAVEVRAGAHVAHGRVVVQH